MYIFKYFSKLQTDKFKNIVKKNKLHLLDYGCGVGTWSKEDIKNNSFSRITLFDKNKKLISYLKKKYNYNKVKINFNKKKIYKNNNYDLIILSSVVQYMSAKEFKKTLINFRKRTKKNTFLIIDIPRFPMAIEFLLLPFFNLKRFLFSISLIFNKEYKKTKKYYHNFNNYNFLHKNYKIRNISNLYDLKFLRYTMIIKEK